VLVQVTGPAEPGKALPVTTRLLFKSRFAIVTPGAPGLNISRRSATRPARAELEALAAAGMAAPMRRLGLILRSACDGAEDEEIAEDIAAMRDLAEAVWPMWTAPELLVDGASAHDLAWRDWLDPAPDEVVEASRAALPTTACRGDRGAAGPAALEGGGHLWIEPTRALVAVDVNTGPDTSPAAALKANVAAARDLPRQLRLRGLGGQVVVDFAPMPKRDRHILDQVLKAAFKPEGEANLAGWTRPGPVRTDPQTRPAGLPLIGGGLA
jgi:ribonuclease G